MSVPTSPSSIRYDHALEAEITRLSTAIAQVPELRATYRPRWLAIQLLEGDEQLLAEVQSLPAAETVLHTLDAGSAHLRDLFGEDVDVLLTDQRYSFVNGLARDVLTHPAERQRTLSEKIDRVVTNRVLSIPIFLALMWIVFKVTTDVISPFVDWIDGVITGPFTNWVVALVGIVGLSGTWFESLLVDGVIAGVGGVLVFVPVLMSLYLALAILEDSGYMARAAFVMDRLMHTLGLHGKSFLPMIVGFGCTVPAIYATRTLDNEKDRILTGLLVPFMSCSARLPVYILLAAIFFPEHAGLVIFGLYLLGIVTAVLLGFVLKHTLFKSKTHVPFIMELPPYRVPTLKAIWKQMWERTASFVQKAWTVIMVASVVLWFLMAIPVRGSGTFANTELDNSAFATVAQGIAPVFAPLGFGNWEATGSLVTGFVKSIPLIVGINLFPEEAAAEPSSLMVAMRANFAASSGGHGALAALAFMVFVLLYTPCMVATAAARHEFGNKWMWVSIVGQLVLAWVAALVVFQGGLLLGLG
jgi:ferrous iron transport protein B